jgi:hypothetical protein
MAVDLTQILGYAKWSLVVTKMPNGATIGAFSADRRPDQVTVRHLGSWPQLAANAESEENARPIVTVPVLNAFIVCGPPVSRLAN